MERNSDDRSRQPKSAAVVTGICIDGRLELEVIVIVGEDDDSTKPKAAGSSLELELLRRLRRALICIQ